MKGPGNCWYVTKQIGCSACGYPHSEARYFSRESWLKEQFQVLYYADPEFAGESLHIAEENLLEFIAAQDRRFFV
jgi:hypothetical protein